MPRGEDARLTIVIKVGEASLIVGGEAKWVSSLQEAELSHQQAEDTSTTSCCISDVSSQWEGVIFDPP